jgi:hypothetical protein
MSKLRNAAIAGIAAVALALPASVAFAGTTPSPSAPTTISPNFGYSPPPTPVPLRFRNWQFDVQKSSIGTVLVNNVEGFGAIPMLAWLNTQNSPVRDTFALGPNSVTIRHLPLPFPTIDLTTCTVEFNEVSPFSIVAGTGTAAGAISQNGLLRLQGLISYPYVKKHGYRNNNQVCPLRFVSVFAILFAIRNNLPVPGLPTPTFTDFAVQGDAQVAVPLAVTPPTPYPSKTTYAPVVSGSNS